MFLLATCRNMGFSNHSDGSAATKPKADLINKLHQMAAEEANGLPPAFATGEGEAVHLYDEGTSFAGRKSRVTVIDGGTLGGCLRHQDIKDFSAKSTDDPLTYSPIQTRTVSTFRATARRIIEYLSMGQDTLVVVLDADEAGKCPLKTFERAKRAKSTAASTSRSAKILQSFGIMGGAREAFGDRYFDARYSCGTAAARDEFIAAGLIPPEFRDLVPLREMFTGHGALSKPMPGPISDVWGSRSVGRPEIMAEILFESVVSHGTAPAGKRMIVTGVEWDNPLVERLLNTGSISASEVDALRATPEGFCGALVAGDGNGIVASYVAYYGEADHGLLQALSWAACSDNARVRVVSVDSDIFLLLLLYVAYRAAPPDVAYATAEQAPIDGPCVNDLTLTYKISSGHDRAGAVSTHSLSVSRVARMLAAHLRHVHGDRGESLAAVSQADLLASLVIYAYIMGFCDYLYGFAGVGVTSVVYALEKCNAVAHRARPMVSIATCPARHYAEFDGHAPPHRLLEIPEASQRMPVFSVDPTILDRAISVTMTAARVKKKPTAKDTKTPREAIDDCMRALWSQTSTSARVAAMGKLRRDHIAYMEGEEMSSILLFKATKKHPLVSAMDGFAMAEFVQAHSDTVKGNPATLLLPPVGELAHRCAAALAVSGLAGRAVAGHAAEQGDLVDVVMRRNSPDGELLYRYMTH